MDFRPVFLIGAFFFLFGTFAVAQELQTPVGIQVRAEDASADAARTNRLKTPWGRRVSPTNVHPDYPRPTLVRKEWLNLNGLWEWRDAGRIVAATSPENTTENMPEKIIPDSTSPFDGKILVPFPIESSLSGVGRSVERIEYRRPFVLPKHWPADHRVVLHFGAVDWETTVYVNNRFVGKHRGGYDPFSFDITEFLYAEPEAVNELRVFVFDPTEHGLQPCGKQSTQPSGIRYTAVSGIWQTVWLEPVPPRYLESIRFSVDVDKAVLTITPKISIAGKDPAFRSRDLSLFVEAFDGEQVVAKGYGGVGGALLMQFPARDAETNPLKTWSPDAPHLYQLRIRLLEREKPVDQVGSYVAFRKIELTKNALGVSRLRLNDRFLFQMGVLDQGYWPDGLYTAPSDQAIQTEIQVAKKLGFNMIRKHVKVEPERWYFWCDRLGMLVWQDMPNGNDRTPESREQFRREVENIVRARPNHPSIVVWTLFNEGWGQHDTERYVDLVRKLDPERLVDAASGWTDLGVGDLNDHHKFPGPEAPRLDPVRASVIGSFGGYTLVPPRENLWSPDTWGYRHVVDSDSLLKNYRKMHEELKRLIREDGLSAAVFHQLVDVESECNGLMSYDRMLLKIPSKDFQEINTETIRYGSASSAGRAVGATAPRQ